MSDVIVDASLFQFFYKFNDKLNKDALFETKPKFRVLDFIQRLTKIFSGKSKFYQIEIAKFGFINDIYKNFQIPRFILLS